MLNAKEKLGMAKFDTTKIEGFEGMSAEEKLNAILEYEAPEPEVPQPDTTEINKLKASLSKANAEAADWKRQLREKQSEQERAEAERAEASKKLQEEVESYRKRERISTYKAKLMEAGVPAEMADTMANALPDGVADDYFATTKQVLETQKQAIRAEALNKQPGLSVGVPPTSQTAAEAEAVQLRRWIGLK